MFPIYYYVYNFCVTKEPIFGKTELCWIFSASAIPTVNVFMMNLNVSCMTNIYTVTIRKIK